jgi:hypothetical protein
MARPAGMVIFQLFPSGMMQLLDVIDQWILARLKPRIYRTGLYEEPCMAEVSCRRMFHCCGRFAAVVCRRFNLFPYAENGKSCWTYKIIEAQA